MIIKDLKSTLDQLEQQRLPYEQVWRDCVKFALPNAAAAFDTLSVGQAINGLVHYPTADDRTRELYDTTFVIGLDRLTAGMVSLATPQGDKWHGVGVDDPFGGEPDADGEEWYDGLRDYLFRVRYDPRAGFANVNERSIKHACGLGTGVYFVKEAFGKDGMSPASLPFQYEFVPLIEAYIIVDSSGRPCGLYRKYSKTAENIAREFGDKCSQRVRDWANDPAKSQQHVTLCHAVFKRYDANRNRLGNMGAAYASFLFEPDNDHLIGESGFYEFPYVVDYWAQEDNGPYGQSPIMAMISEAKSLQVLAKNALLASQQVVRPALASADDNLPRLDMNPGQVNPGYIDENGRLKVQPIVTATNLNFAEALIENRRAAGREGLYLNLWNALASDRQQTAQEVLTRQNEKAELIGPAGARIQAGRAQMVEREIGILERKGAFKPNAPLAAPKSIQGKSLGVKFTSPLDRLRRTSELLGVDNTLQRAFQLAQFDPEVMDNIDSDETIQIAREIGGAPRKMLRKPDEVQARREARAQQQQAAQAAALAKEAGQAGQAIGKTAENADAIRSMAKQMGIA